MRCPSRRRSRNGLCVVVLCSAIAAGAAEPVTPPPAVLPPLTTIAELVQAAAAADANLRARAIRARAAEAAGRLATRWDDPVLALEGGRVLRHGTDDDWHGRVEVTQRVPPSGEAGARTLTADSLRVVAEAERSAALAGLTGEVHRLVVDLRLALAQDAAARATLSDAATALAHVATRLAAGSARDSDLLGVQLDQAEAEAALALAEHQVTAARAALARRCVVPVDKIGDPPAPTLRERERERVIAASATHPRLRQADAAVRSAEAQAALARSGRWSGLRAGVFGEREGDDSEVGLLLELPLPTWNGNEATIVAAAAEAEAARAARDHLERQLAAEAEAAWAVWDAARLRAEHHRTRLLPAATRALDVVLADYAAGRGDLIGVLAALRTRTRLAGESAIADAERDRALIVLHAIAPVSEDQP